MFSRWHDFTCNERVRGRKRRWKTSSNGKEPPLEGCLGLKRFHRFNNSRGVEYEVVFRPPTPPPFSAQLGMGNRADQSWHRTVGFSCSSLFRDILFFVLPIPPRPRSLRAGRDLGTLNTLTVARDAVSFLFSPFGWYCFALPPLVKVVALLRFSDFSSTPFRRASPILGDVAVVSLDVLLSLTDRPPFFPFILGVPCQRRNLAAQRCGGVF